MMSDLNDNDYKDWEKLYQSCDSISYMEIESYISLHTRKPLQPANIVTAVPPAAAEAVISNSATATAANPKISTLSPEIVMAVTVGNLAFIKSALQNNLDVNAVEPRGGGCMLHIAAHNRQFAIFKFLIDSGANINQIDKDNSAPIHFAAYKGDLQTLSFIIEKGAVLSEVDKEGYTALGYAKLAQSPEKIKALIDAGAK